MPKMVMPRNFTVATTLGFTLKFRKGVPLMVPDKMKIIEECMKFGAEHVSEEERDAFLDPGELTDGKPKNPAERQARIMALFQDMNDNQVEHREHFTAANRPSVKFVTSYLGFDVSGEEIKDLWAATLRGE